MKCKACGAALDLRMDRCAGCGEEVEFGRLTGILGRVCRSCDAYNDPEARTCSACGKPLAGQESPGSAESPESPGAPAAGPIPPTAAVEPDAPVVRAYVRGGASSRRAPSSAARRLQAALVLERGAGTRGARFRLGAGGTPAGRDPGGVSFPDDPALAPRHATFLWRGGSLLVRDHGTLGGTFLRLRGDAPVSLRPGDAFVLGERILRYAGPLPPPAPPAADGTRRLGSPRPPAPTAVLEELQEDGMPGRVHVRGGPSIVMGRTGCALSLGEDPHLSPTHAELWVEADGSAHLRDLGSAAGTFVQIAPHLEHALRDGDAIRLGREVLQVSIGEG